MAYFNCLFLSVLLLSVYTKQQTFVGRAINIYLEETVTVHLQPKENVVFQLFLGGQSGSFLIFQAHCQKHNVTVSLNPTQSSGQTVHGSNVGVLKLLPLMILQPVQFYMKSNENETIAVQVSVQMYAYGDPIPGACNMEFPLENDPNIHLVATDHLTTVSFQYTNGGISPGGVMHDCEDAVLQKSMQYDVYQMFMTEQDLSDTEYYRSVWRMHSVENITKYATKIKTVEYAKGHTRLKFASYVGQGAVYGVVVRQTARNGVVTSAAYVPNLGYGCPLTGKNNCSDRNDLVRQVVLTILGVFGLFICFFGHRFFHTSMFLFGCLAFFIVAYNVLGVLQPEWTMLALLVTSVGIALVGGCLWLAFWSCCGVPVLAVLLPGLVLGYLISGLLFNITPLGELDMWKSNFNYGMAFACGVLIVPVILLTFTKTLHIITCALVGSYAVVVAADSFVHTSISYIIINSIRKATVPEFVTAVATIPFQMHDIILYGVWGVLAVAGCTFQFISERQREDFPTPAFRAYKQRRSRRHRQGIAEVNGDRVSVTPDPNERTPLLWGQVEPTAPPSEEPRPQVT